MLEPELSTILKIVSRENGTCGWYQIDRELVREGFRGIHVRNALDTLVAREFISVDGDPKLASSRYWITPAGIAILAST